MTMPFERVWAVLNAEKFLIDLQSRKDASFEIRRQASSILRHFPSRLDMELASKQAAVFGAETEMPWNLIADDTKNAVGKIVNLIETYQIPVGNSAAGEMAAEWTYQALKEIRNEILEMFED